MPTEVLVMQADIAVGESEEGLKRKRNWNGSFSKFDRLVWLFLAWLFILGKFSSVSYLMQKKSLVEEKVDCVFCN